MLPLTKEPSKLVQLSCKETRKIVTSALSEDGKYLAYCDCAKTILYKILFVSTRSNFISLCFHFVIACQEDPANLSMQKVRCLNTEIRLGSSLVFYKTNDVQMLLVCDGQEFSTYEIDDIICQLKSNFKIDRKSSTHAFM